GRAMRISFDFCAGLDADLDPYGVRHPALRCGRARRTLSRTEIRRRLPPLQGARAPLFRGQLSRHFPTDIFRKGEIMIKSLFRISVSVGLLGMAFGIFMGITL